MAHLTMKSMLVSYFTVLVKFVCRLLLHQRDRRSGDILFLFGLSFCPL